jgi:hypothetical protein
MNPLRRFYETPAPAATADAAADRRAAKVGA